MDPSEPNQKLRLAAMHVVLFADLAGVFLFGAEGAENAARANFDLLGLLVVAFATGLGGGVTRDLIIGSVPPAAFKDWRYPVAAFAGAAFVATARPLIGPLPTNIVNPIDAAALGLFAVSGATKAMEFKLSPFSSILLGGLTAVGGGSMAAILMNQVPTILKADLYAIPALLGATITVIGLTQKWNETASAIVAGAACFGLRMLSLTYHWNLPHIGAK